MGNDTEIISKVSCVEDRMGLLGTCFSDSNHIPKIRGSHGNFDRPNSGRSDEITNGIDWRGFIQLRKPKRTDVIRLPIGLGRRMLERVDHDGTWCDCI